MKTKPHLAISACVFLAGCHARSNDPVTRRTNVLRYPMATEPLSLDPAICNNGESWEMLANIFEPLVFYDAKNRLAPALAESWEISKDGLTYTFHLRPNARFHRPFSRPVTAQDVKYSFERALWPETKSPTAMGFLEEIAGAADVSKGRRRDLPSVRAVDPQILSITLRRPVGYFLNAMAGAFVVCREAVEKNGGIIDDRSAVGTGPFRLSSYRHGYEIDLAANEEYYRGRPPLDRIERPIVFDPATSRLLYEKGEVDICPVSLPDLAHDMKDSALKGQCHAEPMTVTIIAGLNQKQVPQFADSRVRRAIAMAIDKDQIARIACLGVCARADTILPAGIPASNPMAHKMPYELLQARDLLAEAGYPGGKGFPTLTYCVVEKTPEWSSAAMIIRECLQKNLGIQVNVVEREEGTFFSEMGKGQIGFYMTGYGGSAEPHDFLSAQYATRGQFNHDSYSNPEFDRLCSLADAQLDDAKRFSLYRQAEQVAVDDVAAIPLFYKPQQILIKPYVRGFQLNGGGLMPHFTTRIAR